MKRSCLLSVASAVALMLPVAAKATPIPLTTPTFETSFGVHTYGGDFVSTDPGPISLYHSVTSGGAHVGSATGNLVVTTNPFPTITASTSASGVGNVNVSERMSYQFRVEDASGVFDPGNLVTAKTIVNYKGSVSAPSTGFAASSFDIGGQNFSESYKVVAGATPSAIHTIGPDTDHTFTGTSFDEIKTYDMLVNAVYRVEIFASAGNTFDGSSTAYLDPFFQLDPSEAGKGYRLVFSPGIDNTIAATPIPSSLLMLGTAIFGLGGIGFAAKRKSGLASATSA